MYIFFANIHFICYHIIPLYHIDKYVNCKFMKALLPSKKLNDYFYESVFSFKIISYFVLHILFTMYSGPSLKWPANMPPPLCGHNYFALTIFLLNAPLIIGHPSNLASKSNFFMQNSGFKSLIPRYHMFVDPCRPA